MLRQLTSAPTRRDDLPGPLHSIKWKRGLREDSLAQPLCAIRKKGESK